MAIASKEVQIKAVEAYKTGKFTQQQLAYAYSVHYKTIQNWLKIYPIMKNKFRKNEVVVLVFLTKRKKNELILLIMDQPSITFENIKVKFNKIYNLSVIHRTLLRLGIT